MNKKKRSGEFREEGVRESSLRKFMRIHDTQFKTLTDGEVTVLTLWAREYTEREIATELGISSLAVGHHLLSIHTKLGIRNRTDGIKFALAFGLIPF